MTTSPACRPETGGRSPQAGPATAGYLLPATGRGTAAQAGAALGTHRRGEAVERARALGLLAPSPRQR